MLRIVIFLTVSTSTLLLTNGTPLHNSDLDLILNLLDKQANEGKRSKDTTSSSSSSESDNGQSFMEHLRNIDVIDLIQKANNDRSKAGPKDNKRLRHRASPNSVHQYYENHREPNNDEISSYRLKDHILKLLQEGKGSMKADHLPLIPSRLLGPVKSNDDGEQSRIDDLQKYSKIFVVLDPAALKSSKNMGDLPNLLSRILSESSSVIDKKRQEKNKKYRYKGFAVRDSLSHRRFRRNSKESGGGMDDDDYRPKRPRSDYGGGGGGGGGAGRTAIPYIRHRGNIYERDN